MTIKYKYLITMLMLLVIGGLNNTLAASIVGGKINIKTQWKFTKSDNIDNNFHLKQFNDSDWQSTRLPHTTNLEPMVVNDQWQGISWYRKTLELPSNIENKQIIIELEAAMNYSQMWINGNLVNQHHGGYLPVVVDITSYLVKDQNNVVAIRLDNRDNPITGPKPLNILDFNTYGGLYRNAWIIVKNQVHISHANLVEEVAGGGIFITTPKVSAKKSKINVKTHVVNGMDTKQSIKIVHTLKFDGKTIKKQEILAKQMTADSDEHFTTGITIANAQLWSPKTPNLYQLETQIYANNELVDYASNQLGIREFELRGQALYVNGEQMFLPGVNRHQEYPFVGYAMSDAAQYRDAKKIKDAGFSYIRLSHYPQSTAFLDACDELGIIVLDAILGWQYYADTDDFRNYTYNASKQLIRRDRNHPSILGWEASLNETQMPMFYMEELHRIVHTEFPGKNVYSAGWKPEVYDIFLQARQHRIMHKYKGEVKKPYIVSEYGDWEYYSNNAGLNQDKIPRDTRILKSSRQLREAGETQLLQQVANIQEAHNDNFNTAAFADGYWAVFDYNRGYHDGIESSGIMDIFRLPKFSYYFFKSQRAASDVLVLKIASYWDKNSPLNLQVFSNADEIKLYLNNRYIGTKQADKGKNTEHLKHPPFTFNLAKFEPGELKAVAYINNKVVGEQMVITPEQPTHLKIWLDESGKKAQKSVNDTVFLYIAAIDKNGTIVPDYAEKLNLQISGDVNILNTEPIKAEAGIATALIQIGDTANHFEVKVSADGLVSNNKIFYLK